MNAGRTIRPTGLRIINHPKLEQWIKRGQARQEPDGLWLHYAVVCTLLSEAIRGCPYCLETKPVYQEKGMTCPACGAHGIK